MHPTPRTSPADHVVGFGAYDDDYVASRTPDRPPTSATWKGSGSGCRAGCSRRMSRRDDVNRRHVCSGCTSARGAATRSRSFVVYRADAILCRLSVPTPPTNTCGGLLSITWQLAVSARENDDPVESTLRPRHHLHRPTCSLCLPRIRSRWSGARDGPNSGAGLCGVRINMEDSRATFSCLDGISVKVDRSWDISEMVWRGVCGQQVHLKLERERQHHRHSFNYRRKLNKFLVTFCTTFLRYHGADTGHILLNVTLIL